MTGVGGGRRMRCDYSVFGRCDEAVSLGGGGDVSVAKDVLVGGL